MGQPTLLGLISLWPPFSSSQIGPAVVYPDVVAAIIGRLRSFDGGSVAAAFGDAVGTTPKFFGDKAVGEPALPYLVIQEPSGGREYISGGNYIDRSQVPIQVYAGGAGGKLLCRQLSAMAAAAINDAPLLIEDAILMKLRVVNDVALPTMDVSVRTPTAYERIVTLDVWLKGQL